MTVLSVLHYPDPRLRKKATSVEVIDAEIQALARDMLETMYAERGIGLAATQVNVQKRLIVMDLSEDKNLPVIMINPEIDAAEGTEEMQEGCLSVPGFYESVTRAETVHYHYLDISGELKSGVADGLLAVCLQHEIDHLNGKLFIDYLSPLKRRMIQKKIQKHDKQPQQLL
jgi:peptide deformylase